MNGSNSQNLIEENLIISGKMKEKLSKRTSIVLLIVFFAIIALVVSGILISRFYHTKKITEQIESLTKCMIAEQQAYNDLWETAYLTMKQNLSLGNITAFGFDGDCMSPDEIIETTKMQVNALKQMLLHNNGNYDPSQLKHQNTIHEYNVDESTMKAFCDRMSNIHVVLSKLKSVNVNGTTKMWTFTEMNTGIEFTAWYYDDGMIEVQTNEGWKLENLYSYYHDAATEEYNEYLKKVQDLKKEQEREYDSDNYLGSLLGLALLGSLL